MVSTAIISHSTRHCFGGDYPNAFPGADSRLRFCRFGGVQERAWAKPLYGHRQAVYSVGVGTFHYCRGSIGCVFRDPFQPPATASVAPRAGPFLWMI